jgi:hypothetical protein
LHGEIADSAPFFRLSMHKSLQGHACSRDELPRLLYLQISQIGDIPRRARSLCHTFQEFVPPVVSADSYATHRTVHYKSELRTREYASRDRSPRRCSQKVTAVQAPGRSSDTLSGVSNRKRSLL